MHPVILKLEGEEKIGATVAPVSLDGKRLMEKGIPWNARNITQQNRISMVLNTDLQLLQVPR